MYVEKYAGRNDTGQYQIDRLDGTPALAWNYTPIHLWREMAESLLTIDRHGIIPLIGLTNIQQPSTILSQAVAHIRAVEDEAKRQLLFASLLALMSDEEHIAMIEKLVESDELLTNTPYLRRIRREGQIDAKREATLEVLVKRLDPSAQIYLDIERQLQLITDLELLDELFSAVLDANTVEEFTAVLENKREPK